MAIALGIDTGGTYTDAVLFDDASGVLRSAKALTTKYDLSVGIGQAMAAMLAGPAPEIQLVSISTTLATNALVEGQGSPVCLLLLGYPEDALAKDGLRQALGKDPVAFIAGGHTVSGAEQCPLDLDAARRAIEANAARVAAFAVSGYFAVRNPEHELRVRDLAREITGLPVTCGHELTSNLHAPRRALTACLNARLIPLLQHLILAVRGLLEEHAIHAPLMVVKGDGSLVEAELALERPVETILSGPAASVVGARHLSGQDDVFVVDMGGTTTDIALLHEGRPVLNKEGATVGGWRTMVEAVSVHTFGLGGDSEVRLGDRGEVLVGPRRVVPLSLLAHQHPETLDSLRRQLAAEELGPEHGRFALRQRPLDAGRAGLDSTHREVWEALADGPVSLLELLGGPDRAVFRRWALEDLVARGLVVTAGFTPSDAAHVLGKQSHWSAEAGRLGAELWARRSTTAPGQASGAEEFCRRVLAQVTVQAGRAVVSTALAESHGVSLDGHEGLRRLFVDEPLAGRNGEAGGLVDVALKLRRPLVAVGAPVGTFYPQVAERLHTALAIPEHADTANAVGAVAGGVVQSVRALVKSREPEGPGFRVHLPSGIKDAPDLEEAVAYAEVQAGRLAEAQAARAGAADVQVQVRRKDHVGHGRDGEIYLDTEIVAVAVGRPRLGGR